MSIETHDDFRGYFEALGLLSRHEARARTHARLSQTEFLADESVVAVHVDNTSRADRVFLSAFDREGRLLRGDTLYVDYSNQRLDVAAEFDHDFTGMTVIEGSELEAAVTCEDGWVVGMHALWRVPKVYPACTPGWAAMGIACSVGISASLKETDCLYPM